MAFVILLLMIGVPILEIAIFIEVGGMLGLWPTVGLVVLTAVVGTAMLRQQGLATLFKAQENLNRGVFPMDVVFDGLCLLVAGALLLTPGFFTDGVGFLLFLPPFRKVLREVLAKRLIESGRVRTFSTMNAPPGAQPGNGSSTEQGGFPPSPGQGPVIDGEWQEVEPDKDRK